jgi:hypothetical protein
MVVSLFRLGTEMVMVKKLLFLGITFALGIATPLSAWNLDAKQINALQFFKNGRIEFTLFEAGAVEPEFRCSTGARGQWFFIAACSAGDQGCLASTNRMASLLLAAKLARAPVHVQRNNCEVTEVALKPM